MADNYTVAVKLSLLDEVTGPLALLTRQLLGSQLAAEGLQKKLSLIKGLFVGGGALMGAGAALAAPLLYATDKAAELQKQLIAVQIATHGTTAQMDAMRGAIEKIAGVTVFSNIDVAKMAKIVATGTGLNAGQVQDILPGYAKYADVQLLMKGTPFEQSITDAIRAAHGAQHYDSASLTQYLNLLTKASLIVPGSVSEVVRGLAYFQGIAKSALGSDDEQNVLAVALANRLGFPGTRGGNNLTAALTRTIPGVFGSGLLTGKSHEALSHMGMIDAQGHAKVFENGKFSILKWMGLTSDYVAREFASHPEAMARQNIMTDFQHGYGTIGSRVTSIMGSDQAIAQWKQIAAQFAEYGGFEAMQNKFADESVAQQYMNAKTNFISAMTEIGVTLLPTASTALKALNTHLQTMIKWLTENPEKVREYATNIGKVAIALAGLGALSWVAGSVMTLSTAIGVLGGSAIKTSAQITAAGGLSDALGTMGLAGRIGLLARSAGLLGLALGSGLAIGSVAWHFMELTKAGDKLGETIARILAFFGSSTAKESLKSQGIDLDANRSKFLGTRDSALSSFYQHGGSDSRSPYIAPSRSGTLNINIPVVLDGRKIAEVVTKRQVREGQRPHTGMSSFDDSQHPPPAGGM
jgi:hypothetical protein